MTYMFNANVQSNVITNNTMIDMMLSSIAYTKKTGTIKKTFYSIRKKL